MATYRIGIGTEFKLDGGVGIGTDNVSGSLGDLRVEGTINNHKNQFPPKLLFKI